MEKGLELESSTTTLHKKGISTSPKLLTWSNAELFMNTVNHCLVAITCVYTVWLCMIAGFWTHLSVHTWLSMIGYQILMAEGILVMYQHNAYTYTVDSRAKKTTLHWVMLAAGSILAIAGTLWEYKWRADNNRRHFMHRHTIWGMASLFLLAPTLLAGLTALFPKELKKYMKPLLSKFTHNVFAIACFVTGMISTIMAFTDLNWAKNRDPGYMGKSTAWMLGIVTFICLIGPAKTFWQHTRTFFKW